VKREEFEFSTRGIWEDFANRFTQNFIKRLIWLPSEAEICFQLDIFSGRALVTLNIAVDIVTHTSLCFLHIPHCLNPFHDHADHH